MDEETVRDGANSCLNKDVDIDFSSGFLLCRHSDQDEQEHESNHQGTVEYKIVVPASVSRGALNPRQAEILGQSPDQLHCDDGKHGLGHILNEGHRHSDVDVSTSLTHHD